MRRGFIMLAAALALFALVCSATVFQGGPRAEAGEPSYSNGLIRLHIIANSDSEADQKLKRDVRDAILASFSELFAETKNIEEARRLVLSQLNSMERVARQKINASGEDYEVKVEWGHFTFPAKTYGTFSLPAGTYEAVRVVIGEGGGQNWWCVLFPPLCFVDISNSVAKVPESTPVSNELHQIQKGQVSPVGGEKPSIEIRLKLLEIIGRSEGKVAESKQAKNKEDLVQEGF